MRAAAPFAVALVLSALLPAGAHAAGPLGALSQAEGLPGCVQENAARGCVDGRLLAGTYGGTLSPDGRFLYVPSPSQDGLAILTRDPATGVLSQAADATGCIADDPNVTAPACTNGRNLDGVASIVFSADGNHAYTGGTNGVGAFQVDHATGRLDVIAGGCVSPTGQGSGDDAGGEPECVNGRVIGGVQALALSPDGKHLYAVRPGTTDVDNAIAILPRAADGTLSQPTGAFGCLRADGNATVPEQQGDGGDSGCAASLVRGFGDPVDLVFSPDGLTLHVATRGALLVLRRSAADGTLTQPAGTAGCVNSAGTAGCADGRALEAQATLDRSPDGTSLYVASLNADAIARFAVAADGSLTQPADAGGCIAQTATVTDGGALPCALARALDQAFSVDVSPDGASVVVGGITGGATEQLAVLDRAPDGTLSQVADARGCVSTNGSASGGGTCQTARGLAGGGAAFTADGAGLYTIGYTGVGTFRREVAPRCADASASVTAGGSVLVPFTCSDGNGDPVTLRLAPGQAPPAGGVALEGSGVRYSARCGTSGAQTFQVVASDGVNDGAPATGTVTVAANPCPQPPGPLGKAPLPSIRPTTVRPDTKRRVSFKLTCAKSAPGRCAGKLVIKTTKVRTSVKTKVRKVVTVVRSRSYSIAAGTSLTVRVTLPKAAAAALRLAKGGKVPLRATLTATKSATFSANSTTRTLTLRARRR